RAGQEWTRRRRPDGRTDPPGDPGADAHPPPHRASPRPRDDPTYVEREASPLRGAAPVRGRGTRTAIEGRASSPSTRGAPLDFCICEGEGQRRGRPCRPLDRTSISPSWGPVPPASP